MKHENMHKLHPHTPRTPRNPVSDKRTLPIKFAYKYVHSQCLVSLNTLGQSDQFVLVS